jgi:AraC-like DNA-binding protein
MDQAVERAVTVIRTRYQERLSVADLAAEAFFSPFHFSRVFRRELGVSPCQYLTAVRLFEAKRLLHATSLNVADIACRVGYVGIGTFTTRFTAMVGVPPGHYRRLLTSRMLLIADGVRQLPSWDAVPAEAPRRSWAAGRGGTILGSARPAPDIAVSRLFVGAFDGTIPQGPPAAWALVPGEDGGHWRLDDVPAGWWVVIALVEGRPADAQDEAPTGSTFFLGTSGPVQVMAGAVARVRLRMRQPHWTDPPILIPMCHRLPALQSIAA